MIAMVHILIRSPPYLVYKVLHNKLGLALAGAVGSATNTKSLSWAESSFLFSNVYQGSIQTILCYFVYPEVLSYLFR